MLLADLAYPASNRVLTIFKEEAAATYEERLKRRHYNKLLSKTRVISEQSFGTWKQCFPMVLGVVRVRTKRVAHIVQATLVLHKFIIKSGGGYI